MGPTGFSQRIDHGGYDQSKSGGHTSMSYCSPGMLVDDNSAGAAEDQRKGSQSLGYVSPHKYAATNCLAKALICSRVARNAAAISSGVPLALAGSGKSW